MKCIICLEDRPPTVEHVIQEGIGGSFSIDRVCKGCNDKLGSIVDAPLLNSDLIKLARYALGVKGGSKKLPNPFGDGTLTDGTGARVNVQTDTPTGEIDVKLHPSIKGHPQGQEIKIDVRDIDILPKLIRRQRKRDGFPDLTDAEMSKAVEAALAKATRHTIQPEVRHKVEVRLNDYRRAFVKIAYELGWYWLGDSYLDDPLGQQIRNYLLALVEGRTPDFTPTNKVDVGPGPELFPLWANDENSHIGVAVVAGDSIRVGVRIFNIFHGIVEVSKSPKAYPGFQHVREGRFILMDPIAETHREGIMKDEMERLVLQLLQQPRNGT